MGWKRIERLKGRFRRHRVRAVDALWGADCYVVPTEGKVQNAGRLKGAKSGYERQDLASNQICSRHPPVVW